MASEIKTAAQRKKTTTPAETKWQLRLYVAGQTALSMTAFGNLKRICEEHLEGKYCIEVIDLLVTPQLAKENNLPAQRGALIVEVVDAQGAAAKAGLVQGDVVVALDGAEIKTGDLLRNTIAMLKPGTSIELQVVHKNGSKSPVKVKLGEMPADDIGPAQRGQRLRPQQRRQLQPQQQHP